MNIQKNYETEESENKWMTFWSENKIYAPKKKHGAKIFSIDTPPPTVSGRMHIGHAFSYTQGDIIARYRRMKGDYLFYPFGTDDNGLPTERLVEKLKNVNSSKMKREDFIKLCEQTIKEIKPEFLEDWKKIGVSADYENTYSTINKHSIKTSQKSFLELYKNGRIYEQESPVSWCVKCRTAIAQAEFDNIDLVSHFSEIVFKQGAHELIIATTRPELLSSCVALFAHPQDERYKHLKGKFAKVPLFNYEVPIMFDETVSIDKGTGLMMVCTFGDKEDVEKWYKYKLPLKTTITMDGKMNDEAQKYAGMNIKDARKQIIEDLKKEGLLLSQKDITHAVNVHERCGTEIEILKTRQWFIKVLDKKEELIKAAEKINWHPEFMKKRYIHWVENLQWDWCISRQRHFGVSFPVWRTKKEGKIILADESQLPVDPTTDKPKNIPNNLSHLDIEPEMDVMDTWATSSLTPQIALHWAEEPDKFNKMFPMTIRLQAHDIIRTWAFYTITKGIFQSGKVPWKEIMISGFILDPKGEKMSKSKNNVIAPHEVIGKYGADALRYWASGSKLGEDMPYQEKDVITGKKTVTKIWNASKFLIMNLSDYKALPLKEISLKKSELETLDKWVLTKLMKTIKISTDSFEEYEYSRAKHETDNFFWQSFCDNYLELVKHRTYGDNIDPESKSAAQKTLYYTLLSIIKLFAPIMPFITEEIYHMYFRKYEKEESIHLTKWPEYNESLVDEKAEKTGDLIVSVIGVIRKYKSTNKLSQKAELEKITITCTEEQKNMINSCKEDIKMTGSVKEIVYKEGEELKIDFR